MDWPAVPVERIPRSRFKPPFCPWPACPGHASTPPRFHRHGSFHRAGDGRIVPRFRCTRCGRTFSQQTFAASYYLKRPELSIPIAAGLVAGSAHRQLARSLRCAPTTVTRRVARLGRHALLLSGLALERLPPLHEPVVFDHFESFAYSQDYPFGMGTAVGHDSWFVYSLDPAPHRRGGRLSPAQQARQRERRDPPRAGGYAGSLSRTLNQLASVVPEDGPLHLLSDGHEGYRRALSRSPVRHRIRHEVHPNPPRGPKGSPRSARARARDRAMFPVDQLHALLRHSAAHHRRETIAFGRRLNALLERGFLFAVWRNFLKGRSERRPDRSTPAMRVGLAGAPWRWEDALAQRLFPGRLRLPRCWAELYRREWITPALGPNRTHSLRNAF
jgi:transposase-like protein